MRFIMAFCVVMAGSAQAQTSAGGAAAQTAASVEAVDREFAHRAADLGTAAAFRDLMDPDAGLVFTGTGKPVRGSAAIFAAMGGNDAGPTGGGKNGAALAWVPTSAWGAASGDLGVTTGDWTLTPPGKTAPMVTGTYVTVWRRDASGHWKGLIDIGQPDPKPVVNAATRK